MTVRVPSTTKANREEIGRYTSDALQALKSGVMSSDLDNDHAHLFISNKVSSCFHDDVYRLRGLCYHPQERLIVGELIGDFTQQITNRYVLVQDRSGHDGIIRFMVREAIDCVAKCVYCNELFHDFLLSHALRNRDRLQEWITAQGADFKDAHNTIGCAKAMWLETWEAELAEVVFLAFEAAILTLLSEEHYGEVYAWESQQRSERLRRAA